MNCCTCGGGSDFDGQRPTTPPPPKVKIPRIFDWLPGAESMEKAMGKVKATMKKKLAPFEKGIKEVYAGLRQPDFNAPPELEGNSMAEVNLVVFFIILLVTIATSLGYLLEVHGNCGEATRSPPWATAMLLSSYALLIPGLTQVIFSFNIVVNVLGHRIDVQPEKGHVACTETITGLVDLLERTGSRAGSVLIVLYAVVVPILKLLLLAVAEFFSYSNLPGAVSISRMCIILVQSISKWACPDMFAYILLVHLVRLLNNDSLILTAAKLDVGFLLLQRFLCLLYNFVFGDSFTRSSWQKLQDTLRSSDSSDLPFSAGAFCSLRLSFRCGHLLAMYGIEDWWTPALSTKWIGAV